MDSLQNSKPVQTAQIISIILGIIDLGLTITSYQPWPDEEFFLAIVIISLFAVCACAVGDRLYMSETTKLIDMVVYSLCGGTLTIASFVMLASSIRVVVYGGTALYAQRIASAVFGFLNGVILSAAGIVILRELQNSIYPINITKSKFIIFEWDRVKSSNIAGKVQVAILVSFSFELITFCVIFKTQHTVVGAVDLALTAHSYFRYSEEIVFLVIVAIFFVLSLMELCGSILGFTKTEDASAFLSLAIAHGIGGVILISGGIVMIVAVVDKNYTDCDVHCGYASYDERIISGVLGAVNGGLYGIVAFALYKASQTVHGVTQYDWDYEDYHPVEQT